MEDNKINEIRASILREIFGNQVNQSPELQKMMIDFMNEATEDIRDAMRHRKFEQERLEKDEKRLDENHAAYLAELKDVQNHRKIVEKENTKLIEHRKLVEGYEERQTLALEQIAKILSLGVESAVVDRVFKAKKELLKKEKKAY
jgi:hypothetical protein